MAKSREPFNPFYVLVLIVGVAFCVTTFAYGTMAYRAASPMAAAADRQPGLMNLVDRYGVQTMGVELGLLGVASFAAMWLDRLRTRETSQEDLAQMPDSNRED